MAELTAFELQRQQTRAASEEERKRQQEALKRRFATQELGAGSGLLEKQQQVSDIERRKALASRLGMVDVEELKQREKEREAETGRTFTREEAEKERGFTEVEAEKARQFTGEQAGLGREFESEQARLARQFAAEQAGLGREFTKEQTLAAMSFQERQSALDRELQREVETGRLSLEESRLAQEASQFTSRLDFDQWATEQGLDQNERNRIWQASESAKQRIHESQIQVTGIMETRRQNELDRELTREVEAGRLGLQEKELALESGRFEDELEFRRWAEQGGWDQNAINRAWESKENAESRLFTAEQAELGREFETKQASLNRELTREVEAGRLSMEEMQMAQETAQFNTRLEFDRWATERGIDEEQANRVWQSKENATQRLFQTEQSILDRELTREVEDGRLTLEESKLAQNARQFTSQQDFAREMAAQGYKQDEIARAWQANEGALDRAHAIEVQLNDQDFQEKLTNIQQDFQVGQLFLTNRLETDRIELQNKLTSLYQQGRAGTIVENSDQFRKLSQMEKDAVLSGAAGMDIAEKQREWESEISARNAMIVSLDPADQDFQLDLQSIFSGDYVPTRRPEEPEEEGGGGGSGLFDFITAPFQ